MKKKRLLYWGAGILVALLFSLSTFAQQTVRGVLRTPTGEPLAGATVAVKGSGTSAVTDSKGEFSINAPVGSTLMVSWLHNARNYYGRYKPSEHSAPGF